MLCLLTRSEQVAEKLPSLWEREKGLSRRVTSLVDRKHFPLRLLWLTRHREALIVDWHVCFYLFIGGLLPELTAPGTNFD